MIFVSTAFNFKGGKLKFDDIQVEFVNNILMLQTT